MYILYTTPSCPNCPRAKQFLLEQGKADTLIIDASTPDGLESARKQNIHQVPTLVQCDQDRKALKIYAGLDNIFAAFQ